jgi:uncharacterized protein YceK
MRKLVLGCAMAAALMGCATVHDLDAPPEAVADRIAGDAVAYNEAYGRAIADQLLLNVLRARDRLPLYHLSMSGIQEGSQVVSTSTLGIGALGLGTGGRSPWAVGNASQVWTDTTKPGYTLDPFGGTGRARQFVQASADVFHTYWDNGWPVEILFYVMVERFEVTPVTPPRGPAPVANFIGNSSGSYRGDCDQRPEPLPANSDEAAVHARDAFIDRCEFIWLVREMADAEGRRPQLERLYTGCEQLAPPPAAQQTCAVRFRYGDNWYRVRLRAMDDMIYHIGSILRDVDAVGVSSAGPMTARVNIRPTNVYPSDNETWDAVDRTAPLFRIVAVPARDNSVYAAQVTYRGVRYAAGPPNNVVCVGAQRCATRQGPPSDATARVLSLLTQLTILSQSEGVQLAPRTLVAPAQ